MMISPIEKLDFIFGKARDEFKDEDTYLVSHCKNYAVLAAVDEEYKLETD